MHRPYFLISFILLACFFNTNATEPVSADMSMNELYEQIQNGNAPLVLDVRTGDEFKEGHIENARLIPLKQLKSHLAELNDYKNEEIVVYCRSGRRAKIAEDILTSNGFKQVRDLTGHILAWKKAGLPLHKGK